MDEREDEVLKQKKDLEAERIKQDDAKLVPKQQAKCNRLDGEKGQIDVDLAIAVNRFNDLEKQSKMLQEQLRDLYTEKRVVDKQLQDLEAKVQNKSNSTQNEEEMKAVLDEATKMKLTELRHSIEITSQRTNDLLAFKKVEEDEARNLLNDKNTKTLELAKAEDAKGKMEVILKDKRARLIELEN